MLMRVAERKLLELGCPKINLLIRAENAAVRGFYESLGFGMDDVVSMGKRLIPDLRRREYGKAGRLPALAASVLRAVLPALRSARSGTPLRVRPRACGSA